MGLRLLRTGHSGDLSLQRRFHESFFLKILHGAALDVGREGASSNGWRI